MENKLQIYMNAQNRITKKMMMHDNNKWNELIKAHDSKHFWSFVIWKGSVQQKRKIECSSVHGFEASFEDLYKSENQTTLYEIVNLDSEMYVPVLDDPKTMEEMSTAFNETKKSEACIIIPCSNLSANIPNCKLSAKVPHGKLSVNILHCKQSV